MQQEYGLNTTGRVRALFIAPAAGASMQRVESVRAVPGRGLEGDRYFYGAGSFSRWPGPHREATLIAEEAIEEMAVETGITLLPEESRRNVLTQGILLHELIGKAFRVGSVQMQGIRLCEPCKYLVRLTGQPGLLPGMVHRGGLRACILSEGILHAGDEVVLF